MSDLISRQAAIDALETTSFDDYGDYMRARELIEGLPSAEPEQKRGKWTHEDCHAMTYKYCCSNCNAHHRAMYNYCPSCGARMEL